MSETKKVAKPSEVDKMKSELEALRRTNQFLLSQISDMQVLNRSQAKMFSEVSAALGNRGN
jgi:hypothetical protein